MAIDVLAEPSGSTDAGTGPVRRGRGRGIRSNEAAAGWLFVAPVVAILGLFLLLPILMALWVSLTDWNGQGSPFTGGVPFVGTDNYTKLFTEGGLAQRDFMTALRNNFYYVLIVVPVQTALALGLALVVNSRMLKGRSFFRTAFYFPSVTSSVAISVVFLFMFSSSGAVNSLLGAFGIDGPQWFADSRGCCTCCSARSGWTPRRPRWPTVDRSACPGGSGSPDPASRCARSSPWRCGPPPAPSC
ncbi:carbohydrate ABC transporter permease [Micromonospora zhanjiangensis]